jgi:hypothetical protein
LLKSELNQLENLIKEVLENHSLKDESTAIQWLSDRVRSIQALCADLKKKWAHELFTSAKEQVITRYVQYHQAGITQLSDQVSRLMPVNELPSEKVDSYPQIEHILDELEQLLTFLKHQCYQYFDPDYKMTIYSCHRHCTRINEFRRELITYSGNEIEFALIEVISISVQEMTAEALQSGISYRHAEHLLNLLRMVHQVLHISKGMTTDDLARSLYRQNLNTLHFFNWYQKHILLLINKLPLKHDQENFIAEQVKTLAGIFADPEKALEPELPSIDLMLLPWLYENTRNHDNIARPISKTNIPTRLPLNLSVPQFAIFIRIFSQVGCFPDTNVAKIARFFTQHFTTKKQSNVSIKSFGKAFYSLDQSAAAIVRDFLQKMINYLNKTYFP